VAEDAVLAAIAVFDKDIGEWDVDIAVTPPGAPGPNRSKGRASNRLVGGRWLVCDYRSDSGFEGHGVYGFDPSLGRYVGTWVDGMQSAFARSVGTWDAESRTMTYETETTHQGRPFRYRETTTTLPDGSLEYRNLVPMPDGSEHVLIHSIYRRR
jgi:hypothetical protein